MPTDPATRAEILQRHHDDALAGHFAVNKTAKLIQRKFHWEGLTAQVKEYVDACHVCQRMKAAWHLPYREMHALLRSDGSWQEITMDFITGLPLSKRNTIIYDACLMVVDRYTKMAKYIPTHKMIDAPMLTQVFLDEIVRNFGVSRGIVSDWGSVFTSDYWSTFCFEMNVKRCLSTAFHPQTDGQTEWQNQTLEHYLRSYCGYQQDD